MSNVYDSGKFGIAAGSIDWVAHDIRVLLVKPGYVFDLAHDFVADVVAHELTDGSYARKVLAGKSLSLAGNSVDYVANNPTWLALAGGEQPAAAIVFKHVTNNADSPLLAYVSLAPHIADGSDYTPKWNNQSPSGAVMRLRSLSASGGGLVQLHDLTYNPVGLWQLQETLGDSSGNGFDLTQLAGVLRYTDFLPGVAALWLFSTWKFRHAVTGTLLQITGDITIEMFVRARAYTSGAILSYDTNSGVEAGNYLYAVGLTGGSTQTQFTSESGAGVAANHNIDNLPGLFEPCHLAVRRQANVVQFFLNGKPWGPASAVLATPTGGSLSMLHLGWVANPAVDCDLASIKIIASALSNAQILAEYNRTLGPFYGLRV